VSRDSLPLFATRSRQVRHDIGIATCQTGKKGHSVVPARFGQHNDGTMARELGFLVVQCMQFLAQVGNACLILKLLRNAHEIRMDISNVLLQVKTFLPCH